MFTHEISIEFICFFLFVFFEQISPLILLNRLLKTLFEQIPCVLFRVDKTFNFHNKIWHMVRLTTGCHYFGVGTFFQDLLAELGEIKAIIVGVHH